VRRLACLVLAGWASTAAAQPGSGSWNAVPLGDLRVGIADVDITPRVGTPLAGYSGRGGPSTGIHDRLRATAVVFDDGHTRAAIVAVDLLNLREADGQAIVAAIERTTSIPRSHVLLNASHTHAAHSLGRGDRGRTELAAELAPAGVIMNAVCHPNVMRSLNRQISADFVGLAKTFVQRSFGGGTVALYLQGTTGDIRANLPSMDPADGFGRNGSEADLVWAGHGLGGQVVQVAAGLRVREKVLQRKLQLPIIAAADVVEVTPDPKKVPGGGKLTLPIRALAIGDFLFVSLPGEPVVEYGLGIEKDLAPLGKTIFVLGYGAGDVGYIPVDHMVDEGGLEAAGPFGHGSEGAIRAGVKALVTRMLGGGGAAAAKAP
jgi:hypothetical protein